MIEGVGLANIRIQVTPQELRCTKHGAQSSNGNAFGDTTWAKQIRVRWIVRVCSQRWCACFFAALGLGFGFVASRTDDRAVDDGSIDIDHPDGCASRHFEQPDRPAVIKLTLQTSLQPTPAPTSTLT
jgi:hypothetical protein